MRQSRRGVPKMLFMARSMAREGRCCQLDCPRADGLFTPDCGLRTTTVCCLPIPAWLNRLPSGTHRRNSLGNNPWGKRKAKKRRRRQRMATTKSMEFFLIGWGRLRLRMSAATGFGPADCGFGCCRCVIQQNNQQRARVFKPSQIYFLMLFFCNFPHFTLVFHASSALWSSSS